MVMPEVPVRLARRLLEIIDDAGGNSQATLKAARIRPEVFAFEDGAISASQLDRLFTEARAQTGREDLGFLIGSRIRVLSYEAVGLAMFTSRNVSAALQMAERYQLLFTRILALDFKASSWGGTFTAWPRFPISPVTRQIEADLFVSSFHTQFISRTGLRDVAYEVIVGSDAPRYRWRHSDVHPAVVTFDGAATYLAKVSLSHDNLEQPMPMANAERCEKAERICAAELAAMWDGTSVAGRVAAMVRSSEGRMPVLATVAAVCNCSERTLDRRLALEGTCFRAIMAETRHDMAKTLLLRADHTISEIAYRLGYTDVANFSRAFRKVANISPSGFRQALSKKSGKA